VELVDKVLDEVDEVMKRLNVERMVKERTRLSALNDIQYFNIPRNSRG